METPKALLGIVDPRCDVSAQLRLFVAGEGGNGAPVLKRVGTCSELDGAFAYNFAQVNQTLTTEQKAQLMGLQTEMLGDMRYFVRRLQVFSAYHHARDPEHRLPVCNPIVMLTVPRALLQCWKIADKGTVLEGYS